MNSIDRLAELFAKFPGIGPRQARRFVYYLLFRDENFSRELVSAIESVSKEISQCTQCMRHFAKNGNPSDTCHLCTDTTREDAVLMVVQRDIDLETVEKSGEYKGRYFVLGGSLPILEKEPEKRIRIKDLESRIKKDKAIKEVILAMNANAEGENTADYIRERLKGAEIEFSVLGRGLSTGAELEYADPETLKNALRNRTK